MMARTKPPSAHSHHPSKLHGDRQASDANLVRYLELLVKELEFTVETTIATTQSIVDRIDRIVDMWFDDIKRTVPEEVLNRPYMEVWDHISAVAIPDVSVTTASLPSSASSSVVVSSSDLGEPSTSKRLPSCTQAKVAASVKAKKLESQNRPTASKPSNVPCKRSLQAPLGQVRIDGRAPVIAPKFDIRKQPATARKARQGETLMSLMGSPVSSQPPEVPVHVHLDNGQVVKVIASNTTDESVKKLCEAIESLCKKL